MNDGTVHLSIVAGVAAVTFDRPEARNAMTWAMYARLGEICEQVAADPSIRVVTFRGAGGEAVVAGTHTGPFCGFGGAAGGRFGGRLGTPPRPPGDAPVPPPADGRG